jgi:PhnB protein
VSAVTVHSNRTIGQIVFWLLRVDAEHALIDQLDQAIDAMLAGVKPARSAGPALSALMEIAGALRDLPDDRYKTRLGRELLAEFQRRTPVIHSITPFISVPEGSRLIEFMKHTFGAEETNRHPHGPDGFVAGLRIGDSDLIVMGGEALRGQECPAALHVYVKDCDATYERALDAGAVTVGPAGVGEPADRPYGERAAFVADPFGNHWFIATRLGPNYVGAGMRHVTPSLLPSNAPPLIDFLQRAFGARIEGFHEESGRMVHAVVRIGEAIVEMGEAAKETSRPFGLYCTRMTSMPCTIAPWPRAPFQSFRLPIKRTAIASPSFRIPPEIADSRRSASCPANCRIDRVYIAR